MRKSKPLGFVLSALVMKAALVHSAFAQLELHVSPKGNDSFAGTQEEPLATLHAARDRIRKLRAEGKLEEARMEVFVHAGNYPLETPLEFTEEDSGTAEFPIVYRGVGGEVVLSGGVRIDRWKKVEDPHLLDRLPRSARHDVVMADLKEWNIHPGVIASRRLHQTMPVAPLELFSEHGRLPRSGWPNQGWGIVQGASELGLEQAAWQLPFTIPASEQGSVWAHGFWNKDWMDSYEPVAVHNGLAKIGTQDPHAPTSIRDGARYRIENVLSELDMPGEWYVDSTTGQVLHWPESSQEVGSVTASVLESVISVYDVEHMTFVGFKIEAARNILVEVVGGCNVRFEDCQLRHAGNVGFHLFRGMQHSIVRCEVAHTGSSAVRIEGGDRATLTNCEHSIEESDVHDFCQNYLAGRPGIAVYGVGIEVAQNHIHHGPDSAVLLHGNEHVVHQNEIHHVCRETDDTGAIYLSHDPTFRGNVIRKNFIHDLGGFSKTGVIGIYLDDFASGTIVENNYLVNTVRGIAVGGGRDNRIENNFIEGALAAIQIDARGLTWAKDGFRTDGGHVLAACRQSLEEHPILSEKYPSLAQLLNDHPAVPKGNLVRSNVFDAAIGIDLQGVERRLVVVERNARRDVRDLALGHREGMDRNLAALGINLLVKSDVSPTSQESQLVETGPKPVGREIAAE